MSSFCGALGFVFFLCVFFGWLGFVGLGFFWGFCLFGYFFKWKGIALVFRVFQDVVNESPHCPYRTFLIKQMGAEGLENTPPLLPELKWLMDFYTLNILLNSLSCFLMLYSINESNGALFWYCDLFFSSAVCCPPANAIRGAEPLSSSMSGSVCWNNGTVHFLGQN